MHTIKITPYLLFEYQCTSGKFIRLPNRIEKIHSVARMESNRIETFCPNWNSLACMLTRILYRKLDLEFFPLSSKVKRKVVYTYRNLPLASLYATATVKCNVILCRNDGMWKNLIPTQHNVT